MKTIERLRALREARAFALRALGSGIHGAEVKHIVACQNFDRAANAALPAILDLVEASDYPLRWMEAQGVCPDCRQQVGSEAPGHRIGCQLRVALIRWRKALAAVEALGEGE